MAVQPEKDSSVVVEPAPGSPVSPWSPFRHATFTVLWTVTVVSNIGTWMQNAAAGWLMTGLNPDPQVVALVQVATSLPMFLFVVPAGALADIVDRRRLLIAVQIAAAAVVAALALWVWADRVTPSVLLAFTFLAGITAALVSPAWQAIGQHERVTHADRLLQDAVHGFHLEGTPKVTHLILAETASLHQPDAVDGKGLS